ncbi:MAG TPA: carboxymuconolactone decarboxylase family protein [Lichenihabitans sp.]|jgi:AhpD family alkylhydroperoxidase|nr:carboxymuconolactone decarboxylase family protein [Lichenihabitans sp.]
MPAERAYPPDISPDVYKALGGAEMAIKASGLDPALIELVKMRASQINGCAYCLDMHSRDARRRGETEQRLYLLNAWRESSLYSGAERAALAWTEALTGLAHAHPGEQAYQDLLPHFSPKAIVDLTALVGMINLWNRLAIGLRYIHPVDKTAAA